MSDLNKTLEQRGGQYGDFGSQATIAQRLKMEVNSALDENLQFQSLPQRDQMTIREGMDMILHKISRIANGNPVNHDSWFDIEGYSKIVRERVCTPTKGE